MTSTLVKMNVLHQPPCSAPVNSLTAENRGLHENEHLETGPETLSILRLLRELFATLYMDRELSNLLLAN